MILKLTLCVLFAVSGRATEGGLRALVRHTPSNNCDNTACIAQACEPEEESFIPRGQCCPKCRPVSRKPPRCKNIQCPAVVVECGPNEVLEFSSRNCCGVCVEKPSEESEQMDCTVVRCGLPEGCLPEQSFVPEGKCCPICPDVDCSAVSCPLPACEEGILYTAEGECCPHCASPSTPLPPRCPELFEYDFLLGICVPITCDAGLNVCPPGTKCKPEEMSCIRSPCPQFICEAVDCAAVSCARPPDTCDDGTAPVVPEGGCCPVCPSSFPDEPPNCAAVLCERPPEYCADGTKPFTPVGECCPICRSPPPPPFPDPDENPNCATVLCARPPDYCFDGRKPIVFEGECCPRCDCSLVQCPPVALCEDGSAPLVPPGDCCPLICPPPEESPDCSTVLCERPPEICFDGSAPFVPEGECCPQCNCSRVLCPPVALCEDGTAPLVPPGDCCPLICPDTETSPDCATVFCELPPDVCDDGTEPVVPPGGCCPTCGCGPDIQCPMIALCQDGTPPLVPPGGCCATLCPPVEPLEEEYYDEDGDEDHDDDGESDNHDNLDCSDENCDDIIECPDGSLAIVTENGCCPECP